MLNDYYDHLNGTDAANTGRLFPFTGGSRFIQNRVLTPGQTLAYGLALFAVVIGGGLWLIRITSYNVCYTKLLRRAVPYDGLRRSFLSGLIRFR